MISSTAVFYNNVFSWQDTPSFAPAFLRVRLFIMVGHNLNILSVTGSPSTLSMPPYSPGVTTVPYTPSPLRATLPCSTSMAAAPTRSTAWLTRKTCSSGESSCTNGKTSGARWREWRTGVCGRGSTGLTASSGWNLTCAYMRSLPVSCPHENAFSEIIYCDFSNGLELVSVMSPVTGKLPIPQPSDPGNATSTQVRGPGAQLSGPHNHTPGARPEGTFHGLRSTDHPSPELTFRLYVIHWTHGHSHRLQWADVRVPA